MRRMLLPMIMLMALASAPMTAAQITALATLAAQGALTSLEKDYQKPDNTVKIDFDTSPNITKRLASGDMHDVLIAATGTIDDLIKNGKAMAATRATFGKIGVGVAKGPSAKVPNLSSADTLKASILQADKILYSQGASGLLVEKLLRDLGVADQIKGKAEQLATGTDVMKALGASKDNQLGLTMVSEIKAGESFGGKLVGPLPAAVQTYTQYDAIVMSGSTAPDAAKAFINSITSASAKRVLAGAGWE